MTRYVEPTETGRAGQGVQMPAANGRPAFSSEVVITDPEQWIATRWVWCVAFLLRWHNSGRSVLPALNESDWTGPPGAAGSRYTGRRGAITVVNVATVAVAHWGLETGWGNHEYNWNAAGIHCAGRDVCFREAQPRDGSEPEEFAAFDSFPLFCRTYFGLMVETYPEAWGRMQEGSADAIMELWRSGYTCGAKTRGEATALVNRVVRDVAQEQPGWAPTLPDEEQRRATAEDVPNRCRPGEEGTPRDDGGDNNDSSDDGSDGGDSSSGSALPWIAAIGFGLFLFSNRRK